MNMKRARGRNNFQGNNRSGGGGGGGGGGPPRHQGGNIPLNATTMEEGRRALD